MYKDSLYRIKDLLDSMIDAIDIIDVIAHHYFKIDADVIFETIENDLNPLRKALVSIRKDVQQSFDLI